MLQRCGSLRVSGVVTGVTDVMFDKVTSKFTVKSSLAGRKPFADTGKSIVAFSVDSVTTSGRVL